MTKDEELLNEIIQRRGYVVIGGDCRLRIGQLLPGRLEDQGRALATQTRWYVISSTDVSDMVEQEKLLDAFAPRERTASFHAAGSLFYRVLSD